MTKLIFKLLFRLAAALRVLLVAPIAVPALAVTWLWSAAARRRFARPRSVARALAGLGIAGRPAAIRIAGGGRAGAVLLVTLTDGRRLVLKRSLGHGSLLALCGRLVGPMPYLMSVGPRHRLRREAEALRRLGEAGVAVPRLLGITAAADVLAMELVDGDCLAGRAGDGDVAARYGRAMAAVHSAGVALCDGHPGNAILRPDGGIVVIDLEFAAMDDDADPLRRAFDLAYASAFLPCDRSRRAFFRGYGTLPAPVRSALSIAAAELSPWRPLLRADRVTA